MLTEVVNVNKLSEYLNEQWEKGMTPRNDDKEQYPYPNCVNTSGDVSINIYPRTDETNQGAIARPWSVMSSSMSHVNSLVEKESEKGYTLFFPPIKKPISETDTQAQKDPENHTRVVLIFFKPLIASGSSSETQTPESTAEQSTESTENAETTETESTATPVTAETPEVAAVA